MTAQPDLVERASRYVFDLFNTRLHSDKVYHNYDRTAEIVAACEEIMETMKLSKADMETVLLAAWLHDAGYIEQQNGYREKSIEIAAKFLLDQKCPQEKTDAVVGCIRATVPPMNPQTVTEQILCDATVAYLGKKSYFEKSELLRIEQEKMNGKPLTEVEWLQSRIDEFTSQPFFTRYAQEEWNRRRSKNLIKLQNRFREVLWETETTEVKAGLKKELATAKLEKEKRPERGVETMLRVTLNNHLNLSSIADQKANFLLSTNSIIISIIVSVLVRTLDQYPRLIVPTVILLAVSLTTVVLAILSTRPRVTTGVFTREDIQQRKANLLFFGNFSNMRLEDFEWGMEDLMKDRDYLYGSMVRDLYFLGRVLNRKYRYLRYSYDVFMYGLIASVIAYAIAFLHAG